MSNSRREGVFGNMKKYVIGTMLSVLVGHANGDVTPKPAWSTSTSKDEMTGEFRAIAASPMTYPTKNTSLPYGRVSSWMTVGCVSSRENLLVSFGFSTAPYLTEGKGTTRDGYDSIHTRVKWDRQVEDVTLIQFWGADADYIHFLDANAAIPKISASSTVLLELNWHGNNRTFFKYSLNGSSRAIAEEPSTSLLHRSPNNTFDRSTPEVET
jgi:hypothetical protein